MSTADRELSSIPFAPPRVISNPVRGHLNADRLDRWSLFDTAMLRNEILALESNSVGGTCRDRFPRMLQTRGRVDLLVEGPGETLALMSNKCLNCSR